MHCPFGDRALKKNKRAVTKPVSYGGKQKKVLIKNSWELYTEIFYFKTKFLI